MTGRVEGKVVVVTGAARGMGRAETIALAREGAVVIAADVLDAEVEELAGEAPGRIHAQHLDVTSDGDWQALRRRLDAEHGRLDGLVHNAGVAARERLPHVDPAEWQRAMDVNVLGPLLGTQLGGHVAAAYTASKWALRGLSRAASLEFGDAGIRVNAIFPGFVDTPLMAGASPRFRDAAIGQTPLGRVGVPEDVAPLVVYLISDESAFVTGAEIAVDGGLTSHVSHKAIADAIREA